MSPTGRVESLVRLIPIHLHVKKLTDRATLCMLTLHKSYPVQSLIGQGEVAGDSHHRLHVSNLSEKAKLGTKSAVTSLVLLLSILKEHFNADADEARPGFCLMDEFSHRIVFIKSEHKAKDDVLIAQLNQVKRLAGSFRGSVLVATNVLVFSRVGTQAAAGAWLYIDSNMVKSTVVHVGKAISLDAKLFALWVGVTLAVEVVEGANSVTVFTDSLSMARAAFDCSPHSGQSHSLAMCGVLRLRPGFSWVLPTISHLSM
jgi:hypothetical protein